MSLRVALYGLSSRCLALAAGQGACEHWGHRGADSASDILVDPFEVTAGSVRLIRTKKGKFVEYGIPGSITVTVLPVNATEPPQSLRQAGGGRDARRHGAQAQAWRGPPDERVPVEPRL